MHILCPALTTTSCRIINTVFNTMLQNHFYFQQQQFEYLTGSFVADPKVVEQRQLINVDVSGFMCYN